MRSLIMFGINHTLHIYLNPIHITHTSGIVHSIYLSILRISITIRHLDFAHSGHQMPYLILVGISYSAQITQTDALQL